ncbi:MAG TPA: hypothetical protein VFW62_10915, partial [bacterium]|nr:hypothetical protein [bacterium]
GFLGKIFGDSDLGCAVGVAISPIGAFASGECDATVEKVVEKVETYAADLRGTEEDTFQKYVEPLFEALLAPVPFYGLGRFAGQQLNRALGLSPEASAELQHRISSAEELLLLGTAPLLFPTPLFPVAVGLERFGYPICPVLRPSISVEDVGNFMVDALMSSALLGVGAVGARTLAKKAAATAAQK